MYPGGGPRDIAVGVGWGRSEPPSVDFGIDVLMTCYRLGIWAFSLPTLSAPFQSSPFLSAPFSLLCSSLLLSIPPQSFLFVFTSLQPSSFLSIPVHFFAFVLTTSYPSDRFRTQRWTERRTSFRRKWRLGTPKPQAREVVPVHVAKEKLEIATNKGFDFSTGCTQVNGSPAMRLIIRSAKLRWAGRATSP